MWSGRERVGQIHLCPSLRPTTDSAGEHLDTGGLQRLQPCNAVLQTAWKDWPEHTTLNLDRED